jgi:LysR family hydrogen peroxide-inducible transcriptional activator
MDLRQLNALLAVADHGSFSAAARALHTVQSNVSTHVARLERELDATLIDRATGSLTEQGTVVAERARRIHAELEALTADVASLNAEVAGTVHLGCIGTTARWLVPPLVERMRADHPRVRLVVIDATTSSLLPQLESGRLELAVVNEPVDDPDVEVDRLFDEDTVLVAPAGHGLHDRHHLGLADLDDEPLLLEPPGTTFRDNLDEQATVAGIRLVAQAEVDGMRLLASLAFQGFGAALLPASHPRRRPRWPDRRHRSSAQGPPVGAGTGTSRGGGRRRRGRGTGPDGRPGRVDARACLSAPGPDGDTRVDGAPS